MKKRDTCEHGKPFPRYANCDACREAIDREDAEADAGALALLNGCEFPQPNGPMTAPASENTDGHL